MELATIWDVSIPSGKNIVYGILVLLFSCSYLSIIPYGMFDSIDFYREQQLFKEKQFYRYIPVKPIK